MGESSRRRHGALIQGGGEAEQPVVVDTLGGRMHVRSDSCAATTPHGQLVFFAEFLVALSPEFDETMLKHTPLKRLGEPRPWQLFVTTAYLRCRPGKVLPVDLVAGSGRSQMPEATRKCLWAVTLDCSAA